MRGRVLVLEHHRDLREALAEALLDEGYVVTPAATVGAARAALQSAGEGQLPDVIVTDASAWRELSPSLRSDPMLRRIAIVTLSFRFDPPSDADFDLRRPFRLDDFLGAVRTAEERHRATLGATPDAPP